jgi:phosphoserine phosphatase
MSAATDLVLLGASGSATRIAGVAAADASLAAFCAANRLDHAIVPAARRLADFRLVAMDMDSTLITIECIDEIADLQGLKPQVAAITAQAMRGEIAYPESLRRRVALLAGLHESALARVYDERLRLSPGAETLIARLKTLGIHTLLVSGGFTFFTARLQTRLGLDEAHSNTLEIADGKLTGGLVGPIFDGDAKAAAVRAAIARLGIDRARAIVIGDGANDLAMMAEADVSIAYRAKPVVQAKATYAFNYCGLDGLLALYR